MSVILSLFITVFNWPLYNSTVKFLKSLWLLVSGVPPQDLQWTHVVTLWEKKI